MSGDAQTPPLEKMEKLVNRPIISPRCNYMEGLNPDNFEQNDNILTFKDEPVLMACEMLQVVFKNQMLLDMELDISTTVQSNESGEELIVVDRNVCYSIKDENQSEETMTGSKSQSDLNDEFEFSIDIPAEDDDTSTCKKEKLFVEKSSQSHLINEYFVPIDPMEEIKLSEESREGIIKESLIESYREEFVEEYHMSLGESETNIFEETLMSGKNYEDLMNNKQKEEVLSVDKSEINLVQETLMSGRKENIPDMCPNETNLDLESLMSGRKAVHITNNMVHDDQLSGVKRENNLGLEALMSGRKEDNQDLFRHNVETYLVNNTFMSEDKSATDLSLEALMSGRTEDNLTNINLKEDILSGNQSKTNNIEEPIISGRQTYLVEEILTSGRQEPHVSEYSVLQEVSEGTNETLLGHEAPTSFRSEYSLTSNISLKEEIDIGLAKEILTYDRTEDNLIDFSEVEKVLISDITSKTDSYKQLDFLEQTQTEDNSDYCANILKSHCELLQDIFEDPLLDDISRQFDEISLHIDVLRNGSDDFGSKIASAFPPTPPNEPCEEEIETGIAYNLDSSDDQVEGMLLTYTGEKIHISPRIRKAINDNLDDLKIVWNDYNSGGNHTIEFESETSQIYKPEFKIDIGEFDLPSVVADIKDMNDFINNFSLNVDLSAAEAKELVGNIPTIKNDMCSPFANVLSSSLEEFEEQCDKIIESNKNAIIKTSSNVSFGDHTEDLTKAKTDWNYSRDLRHFHNNRRTQRVDSLSRIPLIASPSFNRSKRVQQSYTLLSHTLNEIETINRDINAITLDIYTTIHKYSLTSDNFFKFLDNYIQDPASFNEKSILEAKYSMSSISNEGKRWSISRKPSAVNLDSETIALYLLEPNKIYNYSQPVFSKCISDTNTNDVDFPVDLFKVRSTDLNAKLISTPPTVQTESKNKGRADRNIKQGNDDSVSFKSYTEPNMVYEEHKSLLMNQSVLKNEDNFEEFSNCSYGYFDNLVDFVPNTLNHDSEQILAEKLSTVFEENEDVSIKSISVEKNEHQLSFWKNINCIEEGNKAENVHGMAAINRKSDESLLSQTYSEMSSEVEKGCESSSSEKEDGTVDALEKAMRQSTYSIDTYTVSSEPSDHSVQLKQCILCLSKLKIIRNKITQVLDEINSRLYHQANQTYGPVETARRHKRDNEFSTRFSRVYLYQLSSLVPEIKKSFNFMQKKGQINIVVFQKFVSLYQIVFLGLQAYLKHMPLSAFRGLSDRMRELLDYLLILCNIAEEYKLSVAEDDIKIKVGQLLETAAAKLTDNKKAGTVSQQRLDHKYASNAYKKGQLKLKRKCSPCDFVNCRLASLPARLYMYGVDQTAKLPSKKGHGRVTPAKKKTSPGTSIKYKKGSHTNIVARDADVPTAMENLRKTLEGKITCITPNTHKDSNIELTENEEVKNVTPEKSILKTSLVSVEHVKDEGFIKLDSSKQINDYIVQSNNNVEKLLFQKKKKVCECCNVNISSMKKTKILLSPKQHHRVQKLEFKELCIDAKLKTNRHTQKRESMKTSEKGNIVPKPLLKIREALKYKQDLKLFLESNPTHGNAYGVDNQWSLVAKAAEKLLTESIIDMSSKLGGGIQTTSNE